MLKIGLPTGIQSSMYNLSNILVQAAINAFGVNTMAAWTAFGKIDSFFWMLNGAFGIAVTTFVGQNFGAGLPGGINDERSRGNQRFFVCKEYPFSRKRSPNVFSRGGAVWQAAQFSVYFLANAGIASALGTDTALVPDRRASTVMAILTIAAPLDGLLKTASSAYRWRSRDNADVPRAWWSCTSTV